MFDSLYRRRGRVLLSWISNRGHDFLKSSAAATCYRVAAAAVEGDLCTFESPRINSGGVRESSSRRSHLTLREPAGLQITHQLTQAIAELNE